jgi:plasmid stability protein
MTLMRGVPMAQIIVRDLEDSVKSKLQRLAALHGHSMEEEVRDILRNAVKDAGRRRGGFGTESAALFKGIGLDEPIPEFRIKLRIPKFD